MPRVLVADDAPDIRMLIRVLLSSEPDWEIVGEAALPEEAIRMAEELQPDVIITDHSFEVPMTGLDAAPLMKAAVPHVKIILFSAYDNLHDRIRATPAVDAFVLKTNSHKLVPVTEQLLAGTK